MAPPCGSSSTADVTALLEGVGKTLTPERTRPTPLTTGQEGNAASPTDARLSSSITALEPSPHVEPAAPSFLVRSHLPSTLRLTPSSLLARVQRVGKEP